MVSYFTKCLNCGYRHLYYQVKKCEHCGSENVQDFLVPYDG